MDIEQTELMKQAMMHYIDIKMGDDCACLPNHDMCEFCKNKRAYDRLQAIVYLRNGDYPK